MYVQSISPAAVEIHTVRHLSVSVDQLVGHRISNTRLGLKTTFQS